MKRRPLTRAELLARLPRAFRPKLRPDQLRDLGLCHNQNLDAIAKGAAEPSMLWEYIGGVLTWWKVAHMLEIGVPEMDLQLEVATRLVERFGRTNRVLFDDADIGADDSNDLPLACTGVMVMDQLAELVDLPTATIAADWSQAEVDRMAAMVDKLQRQAA